MIRGGSWNNDAQNCRSANRNNNSPGNRNNNLGFRLASTQKCLYSYVYGFKKSAFCVQMPVLLRTLFGRITARSPRPVARMKRVEGGGDNRKAQKTDMLVNSVCTTDDFSVNSQIIIFVIP